MKPSLRNLPSAPRILFVSAHCPHGPSYGARLRALHIARILRDLGPLGMVLLPFEIPDPATLRQVKGEFDLRAVLFCDRRLPVTSRLSRELDPYCAETQGAGLGLESSRAMERIAGEYDLIWFHGMLVPNCLGRRTWPCSILDIDDIQSQVFTGRARHANDPVSWFRARRQAVLWRRRERVLLNRFGIVTVCSDSDRHYLGGDAKLHTIPNGFSTPRRDPDRCPVDPPRIGFIGTLNYSPNVEGLRWFINCVWPLIKAGRKDARLRLIGCGTDREFISEGADIDGLGFMEDVASEVAGWSASIVPIKIGGGTRIKIAESFSRKCPVVSTTLGAYGYEVESGRECLLADSPAEIATACLKLLDNRDFGTALAERAWQRFSSEWSWEAIAPRVSSAVDACLQHSGTAIR